MKGRLCHNRPRGKGRDGSEQLVFPVQTVCVGSDIRNNKGVCVQRG